MDSLTYDVFISYARADNADGFVTALRDALYDDFRAFSSEPFRIFLDRREIRNLQDWDLRLRQGLRTSQVLLICLSPNYLRSNYCRWEWDEFARVRARRLGGADPVAGVDVRGADGDQEYDEGILAWLHEVRRVQLERLEPWFSKGVRALQEPEARKRVQALGFDVHAQLRQARQARAAPGNLKRHNPGFVGRVSELRALRVALTGGAAGVIAVVHGIGGMGKTDLVTTYAHSHAHAYQGGTWRVDAEGHINMLEAVAALASYPELGMERTGPDGADRRAVGRHVLAHLAGLTREARDRDEATAGCLLLLDNVSEPELLSESQISELPAEPWFHVAATTRLGGTDIAANDARRSTALIEVGPLGLEDASALIREHQPARDPAKLRTDFSSPQEAHSAAAIVGLLDAYTLAVEQAAVYLGSSGSEPSQLLQVLQERGAAVLDQVGASPEGAAIRHEERLAGRIVDQTLERLPQRARTALAFGCLLPPDAIPWDWLETLTESSTHQELAAALPGLSGGDDWASTRRMLEGRRLLTLADDARFARLHRVMQQHLRNWMTDHEVEHRFDLHLHREARSLQAATLPDAALLSVAARALSARLRDGQHELVEVAAGLLDRARYRVDVATVDDLATATLRAYERLTVANAGDVGFRRGLSNSVQAVGELHEARGDIAAALEYYAKALAIDEELLAEQPDNADHRYELTISLARIATLRIHHGEPRVALAAYSRALVIAEDLADTYPDVVRYRNQLADILDRIGVLYRASGNNGVALDHFERALDIAEQLATEYPDDPECQRNLAMSLERVGRMLADEGDATTARRLYRRALDITQQLADDDRDNTQYQRDLSSRLHSVGELPAADHDQHEALDLYRRALNIDEKLAAADPANIDGQRNLSLSRTLMGDLLLSTGDMPAALSNYLQALQIDEQLVRTDTHNTQYRRDLLLSHEKAGNVRQALHENETARDHYRRARQIAEQLATENPDNPRFQFDLACTTSELANVLDSLGDSSAFVMWVSAHRILSALDAAGELADDGRRLFEYVTIQVEGTPEDNAQI